MLLLIFQEILFKKQTFIENCQDFNTAFTNFINDGISAKNHISDIFVTTIFALFIDSSSSFNSFSQISNIISESMSI